jgi:hypothetical protein
MNKIFQPENSTLRSLNFLDLKSAKIFCFPGIWEHASHILFLIQNNQICLLTLLHENDLIPPILVM